jgi:hypothetical protein
MAPSSPDRLKSELKQTLTFYMTLVSGNLSWFAQLPRVNATTGELSFIPALNAYGNSTWRVVLADSGGAVKRGHTRGQNTSAPKFISIDVLSVNDAPSFAIKKPNMTLLATGFTTAFWEPSVVSEWKAGPPDEEASQTLTFSVQTDARLPASVWVTKPAVSLNGSLSMQIASDSSFETSLTIVLRDDGGTHFGGVDTFARNITVYFVAIPKEIRNLQITQSVQRQLEIIWTHEDMSKPLNTLGRTKAFLLELIRDCSAYMNSVEEQNCTAFKLLQTVNMSTCSSQAESQCSAIFLNLEPTIRYKVSVRAKNDAGTSTGQVLGAVVLRPPSAPASINMTHQSTSVAMRSLLILVWDRYVVMHTAHKPGWSLLRNISHCIITYENYV